MNTVAALQAEIVALRDRVAALEAVMGIGFVAPLDWRLTPYEAKVFGILMARTYATADAIMVGLYSGRLGDEPNIKIVLVYICHLRAKLRPHGLAIETRWGGGYQLTPATKALARMKISAAEEALAA